MAKQKINPSQFNTQVKYQGNMSDISALNNSWKTSATQETITIPGKYKISGTFCINANSQAGNKTVRICKNGSGISQTYYSPSAGMYFLPLPMTVVFDAVINDVITFQALDEGNTGNASFSGSWSSYVIERIG